MTTKKMYEKPSMKVFPLRQKPQLLTGSGTNGSRSPYGDPVDNGWNWE